MFCTSLNHACAVDADRGCASCHRMCHKSCEDVRCKYTPCALCLSMHVPTPEDWELCVEAQRQTGCHACGRQDCWSSNPVCSQRSRTAGSSQGCAVHHHVCGPSLREGGCANCGRRCHATNDDPLCVYFARSRTNLNWRVNAQQLMDTQPGTQGTLRHCTQVDWQFVGHTASGAQMIHVDGSRYFVGRGDPGRLENGECNNCLIDSLRQCLRITCDRRPVRQDLMNAYRHAEGRARVTFTSFLDIESHWQAVVDSLFRHGVCESAGAAQPQNWCVVALFEDHAAMGVVLGDVSSPQRLIVLNRGDMHFDPVLPFKYDCMIFVRQLFVLIRVI